MQASGSKRKIQTNDSIAQTVSQSAHTLRKQQQLQQQQGKAKSQHKSGAKKDAKPAVEASFQLKW
jgi:hypothetical protein